MSNKSVQEYSPLNIVVLILLCLSLASISIAQDTSGKKTKNEDESSSAQKLSPEHGEKNPDGTYKYTNELVNETSPYLLMHAHNPVNWYGWGQKSLELAKKENKPIFLSIGYSSCHWCHVMERESFLDKEIATFLNENFVCIKIDREERPDVDAIYMEALRVVNPRVGGGWPLSMFLTPDAKPFFGGTYFPARDGDRGAKLGFLSIVKRVNSFWKNNTDRIKKDAEVVSERTQKRLAGLAAPASAKLDANWINMCINGLKDGFDPQYGGFRYARNNPKIPKFPEPSNLLFLADQLRRQPGRSDIKNMLVKTCERMMMGGILDHLGGGFHRYSVDRYWAIPHFEKMLYDNGQLATVYSEVYELTKREDFKMVVEEMLSFVLREMTDNSGGFYSALDAESEGEEGKFYRWEKEEVQSLLKSDEFDLFAKVYGLNQPPNFEEYYAPQLKQNWEKTAQAVSLEQNELHKKLLPVRRKLFEVRSKRPRPLLDNKVLASWNGLMIRGFADAGRIFRDQRYVQAAAKAADFVMNNMIDDKGRLLRTATEGKAKLNAYLEDYACMIDGLLALHQATDEKRWLESANRLQQKQDELFWDAKEGGYFYTSNDHEELLARAKKPTDGAMPSGNSVAAGNLMYLADKMSKPEYVKKARKTAIASSPMIEQFPIAAPRMLITVASLLERANQQDK